MSENEQVHHSLKELMTKRWSPRGFSEKEVKDEQVNELLEAARWAPSAYNEQPWRFVVGKKGTEKYNKILESLNEWNQIWAKHAPLLILNVAKKEFSHNNTPNRTAEYDLGQAVFAMVLRAVDLGLAAHQMSGFDHDKMMTNLNIPNGFEAVSVIAIGYLGDDSQLPEDMKKMEKRERIRKPINDLLL